MLNSKQRSRLRSIASTLEPAFQLGKTSVNEDDGAFTATFLQAVNDALEARELVKLTVLKNAAFTARELGDELAAAVRAECVATIGHKIILYRRSDRKDIRHVEF